jgi:hypothetical protein
MISRLSIVGKTSTFSNETIYITPKCIVHFHGHWNKMVLLLKPSIFVDINNGAKFCSCIASQLMTFETTVSRVRSITTTSIMKTWFS